MVVATNGQTLTINQAPVHSTVAGDNATDGGLAKQDGGTMLILTVPYSDPWRL